MLDVWFLKLVVVALLLQGAFSREAMAQSTTVAHADGSPRWQYTYNDGLPEGEALQFYVDGSIMVRGAYRQGLKHGMFSYYTRDGAIHEQALYVHGKREWRRLASDPPSSPPLQLLANDHSAENKPAAGKLELFSHPFLLVIPFSSLDRLSKRMGLVAGISRENGKVHGRRAELFVNLMKGKYGLHTSLALSMTRNADAEASDTFLMEQGSLSAVVSYRLVDRVKHLGFVRAGFGKSLDLASGDDVPVRGVSAGQRPSDLASTFNNASVVRGSVNHFYMRKHFVSQVDLGLDAVQYEALDSETTHFDVLFRFNAGAATGTKSWKFALETANSLNTGGRSLFTLGGTVTYYSGSNAWVSLNTMMDQHAELSLLASVGSWKWK